MKKRKNYLIDFLSKNDIIIGVGSVLDKTHWTALTGL